ncbi:MAG: dTDP-4-dehydrorhamnose reductase [Oscillospiraceae bacterium]|nr:dTDP-4-dehydrorhamnose reductase [Oscillospiraceae bacterium]
MNILVTGASGQLGHDLVLELAGRGHTVTGVSSKELNLLEPMAVQTYLCAMRPDAVMHCAGYTAVDLAEDEKEKCFSVNSRGTETLAAACAAVGSKLLFISTDYVFSGDGERPWEPDDPPKPLNTYGLSKYRGEEAVRRYVPEHFIVRISWLFGVNGKNFVKTMLRLGKEREQITVVNDQIGSPTYTKDLAVLLADMIVTEKYGTYHATNEGFCSWYEFACAIMKEAELPCRVLPVSSDQYPSRAKRPANSRMSKDKLTANGFRRLPPWQDALRRYLAELKENYNG